MKLKSLILGSVAAAGLSTAGYAADLGVLTSLDVCDALGLSGLTISSDTNCLQISGSVDYRLRYGNFRGTTTFGLTYDGRGDTFRADGVSPSELDWDTRARAYLKAVATADSDFGPASAVIGLRQVDEWRNQNEANLTVAGGDHTNGVQLEEAYVSIGDSTVIMAGKKKVGAAGSIANIGDDSPYSFLYNSDRIDGGGVLIDGDDRRLGGHSIQIVSDLGNGISAGIALENIDTAGNNNRATVGGFGVGNDSNLQTVRDNGNAAGTLIGVLQYAGDGITAHATGLAYGVLDGQVDAFAIHAGVTGTFDIIKVRGAVGYDSNFKFNGFSVVHALASAEATFDMFKLAVSGELANFQGNTDFGIGARATATITEGVSFNLDGSYFRDASLSQDTYRIQGEVSAAVTETITLTAAVGGYFGNGVNSVNNVNALYYGKAGLGWNPGGGFTSGANIEINSDGGYRGEFTAAKTFN